MPLAAWTQQLTTMRRRRSAAIALSLALCASAARGQSATPQVDRFELRARSETYVRYFQRALLPGPGGAMVSTDTVVPVYQYLSVDATDVDAPWSADSIDVELSMWGSALATDVNGEHRLEGDVTVASVRQRFGPGYVKFGRQVYAGGAARFSWFDGISTGVRATFGLGMDAYAGFTVLPNWSQRPGYRQLGSASDTLLRSPDALPPPSRAGSWLTGARTYYAHPRFGEVGASFHEQRENSELARRQASADLRFTPSELADLAAYGVMDADSGGVADARVALNVRPSQKLAVTTDYLHANPALFLSRQSVLSVFSTAAYDEVGGEATYHVVKPIVLGASAYAQFFGPERQGMRARGWLRLAPLRGDRLVVQVYYGRVVEPDNGYHSTRLSLRYRVAEPVVATAEQYIYFYDAPIRGFSASSVEAANVEWEATRALRLLLGGMVSRSPYAALDAQTLLRAIYEFDAHGAGVR